MYYPPIGLHLKSLVKWPWNVSSSPATGWRNHHEFLSYHSHTGFLSPEETVPRSPHSEDADLTRLFAFRSEVCFGDTATPSSYGMSLSLYKNLTTVINIFRRWNSGPDPLLALKMDFTNNIY